MKCWNGGHLPGLATPLLGKSRRAAFSFVPSPAILPFAPGPFVGLFVPLAPVVLLPPRWRIATPLPPVRRRDSVVADRDPENRSRDIRRSDDRPRTVPARPDVPSPTVEGPVLVGV